MEKLGRGLNLAIDLLEGRETQDGLKSVAMQLFTKTYQL
jgi:hypothetical protein